MASFKASQVFGGFLDSTAHSTNATIDCQDPRSPFKIPSGFDFVKLWTITQNYYDICGSDGAWLFGSNPTNYSLALTLDVCIDIAGVGHTPYPSFDVLARLITWKAPLIQLIATFPRPPLGLGVQTLTALHLLSDPIGSFTDLLWKLETCQRRVVQWEIKVGSRSDSLRPIGGLNEADREKLAQALSIITESYDELGEGFGNIAYTALLSRFEVLFESQANNSQAQRKFLSQCFLTAGLLRADRSTVFLPVITAIAIFILALLLNLFRLVGDEQDRTLTTTFVNIEVYSTAFSALFFWIICHVAVAAIIGISQTEEAIPRILKQFQKGIPRAQEERQQLPDLDPGVYAAKDRWLHGGNYALQPLQRGRLRCVWRNTSFEKQSLRHKTDRKIVAKKILLSAWPCIYLALPWVIFATAILMGLVSSLYVPPGGWTCRSTGEFVFAVIWPTSYAVSLLLSYFPRRVLFGVMFGKDLLTAVGIIGWILATQVGVLNRCDCYARSDGKSGLTLPQQPEAWAHLQAGLRPGGYYMTTIGVGILLLILFFGLICARYQGAIRMFLQRDKCSSEAFYSDSDNSSARVEPPSRKPDKDSKGIDVERIEVVELKAFGPSDAERQPC